MINFLLAIVVIAPFIGSLALYQWTDRLLGHSYKVRQIQESPIDDEPDVRLEDWKNRQAEIAEGVDPYFFACF